MLRESLSYRALSNRKIFAISSLVGLAVAVVQYQSYAVTTPVTDESSLNMANMQMSKTLQPANTVKFRLPQQVAQPTAKQVMQLERVLQQPSTRRFIKQEAAQLEKEMIVAAKRGPKVRAEGETPEEEEFNVWEAAMSPFFLPGKLLVGGLDRVSGALGVSEATGSAVFVGVMTFLYIAFSLWLASAIQEKYIPGFNFIGGPGSFIQ
jgi:hypothetical protein